MASKRDKINILEKTSDMLDIPGELALGLFRVTLTGPRKVNIENHRGLLQYEDDLVGVNCGKTIVKIHGRDLEVKQISSSEMLVVGNVKYVEFE